MISNELEMEDKYCPFISGGNIAGISTENCKTTLCAFWDEELNGCLFVLKAKKELSKE